MSPKPSLVPSRSVRAPQVGSRIIQDVYPRAKPGSRGRTICSEPDGLSLWKRSGKRGGKQSVEVSTPSWGILGCPRHWRAQNHSGCFLEIQFPSAAGWNDLKCPFFPVFPSRPSRSGCSRLRSRLSTRCVPGSTESFYPSGTRLFLHLQNSLRGGGRGRGLSTPGSCLLPHPRPAIPRDSSTPGPSHPPAPARAAPG